MQQFFYRTYKSVRFCVFFHLEIEAAINQISSFGFGLFSPINEVIIADLLSLFSLVINVKNVTKAKSGKLIIFMAMHI